MNADERRTLWVSVLILFLASLARFAWEVRPEPPFFPPDASAYATLLPETEAAVADEARRGTPLEAGERLELNRVDDVELARLPGVGPALALRIVAFRESRGWIRSADDLLEVAGIGPTTLERIRPHLALGAPPPGWQPPPGGLLAGGAPAVDLNRAGAAELESLPGVGPALAERILESRRNEGPFPTVDALDRVPGIGPALVERLRPRVTVF